jgi:hypothetical protein
MTLDEFGETLNNLTPGKGARVPYDLYEKLFPPGEPDHGARESAYNFARAHDVKINNRPDDNAVWFYKDS